MRIDDPRLPGRFWEKVAEDPSGCWLWKACRDDGYGKFGVGRSVVLAHRLAYEALVGPIPEGMQIDHRCRVRHCVNPAHMEPVTHQENILRGVGFSSRGGWAEQMAARTHCKRGHEFTEANTYHYKGSRNCRACATNRRARHAAKETTT